MTFIILFDSYFAVIRKTSSERTAGGDTAFSLSGDDNASPLLLHIIIFEVFFP